MPPPRATRIVHEVGSATDVSPDRPRSEDALVVFTLSEPTQDWDGLVLALADGDGAAQGAALASAAATEALEDGLTQRVGELELGSPAWQERAAEALAGAFGRADARLRSLARDPDHPDGDGVSLTAAMLLGNWLGVAHRGHNRVYRLSGSELEQLTEDPEAGRVAALGVGAQRDPAIRFSPVQEGDVIAVCSDGVHRVVEGPELARLLSARKPVADLAAAVTALAQERGMPGSASVAVARVGKLPPRALPEPGWQPREVPVGDDARRLPRYKVTGRSRWRSPAVTVPLAVALALAVAVAGWRLWRTQRELDTFGARPAADSIRRDGSGAIGGGFPPVVTVMDSLAPAPAVPPELAAREIVPGDSLESIERQIRELRARRERDSAMLTERRRGDKRLLDSLAAAEALAELQLRERLARDSIARVAEERQAELDRLRKLQAAEEARLKAEAEARAAAAMKAEDARARTAREAAGREALQGWLDDVGTAVNAGNASAPALASGPAAFAKFVGESKPKLADARLLQVNVNDSTGEATAEWMLRWRGEFGTNTQRRMKAVASVTRDGDTWRAGRWRIVEGAP
ncbi:MAG: SpoIIE family protein phosphatase [Gemmatimonadales bacterium]|nr:SpoIIE family protein phosphatase [Gemmatimonadales bacterium]